MDRCRAVGTELNQARPGLPASAFPLPQAPRPCPVGFSLLLGAGLSPYRLPAYPTAHHPQAEGPVSLSLDPTPSQNPAEAQLPHPLVCTARGEESPVRTTVCADTLPGHCNSLGHREALAAPLGHRVGTEPSQQWLRGRAGNWALKRKDSAAQNPKG